MRARQRQALPDGATMKATIVGNKMHMRLKSRLLTKTIGSNERA